MKQELKIMYYNIPKSTTKAEIDDKGLQEWQNVWNNTTKGATLFPFHENKAEDQTTFNTKFLTLVAEHGKS